MNRKYSLRNDEQTVAFLQFPTVDNVNLRRNYVQILQVIQDQLENQGNTLRELLGSMDATKALSSFQLFHRIGQLSGDKELAELCDSVLTLADKSPIKKKKKRSLWKPSW